MRDSEQDVGLLGQELEIMLVLFPGPMAPGPWGIVSKQALDVSLQHFESRVYLT